MTAGRRLSGDRRLPLIRIAAADAVEHPLTTSKFTVREDVFVYGAAIRLRRWNCRSPIQGIGIAPEVLPHVFVAQTRGCTTTGCTRPRSDWPSPRSWSICTEDVSRHERDFRFRQADIYAVAANSRGRRRGRSTRSTFHDWAAAFDRPPCDGQSARWHSCAGGGRRRRDARHDGHRIGSVRRRRRSGGVGDRGTARPGHDEAVGDACGHRHAWRRRVHISRRGAQAGRICRSPNRGGDGVCDRRRPQRRTRDAGFARQAEADRVAKQVDEVVELSRLGPPLGGILKRLQTD